MAHTNTKQFAGKISSLAEAPASAGLLLSRWQPRDAPLPSQVVLLRNWKKRSNSLRLPVVSPGTPSLTYATRMQCAVR